MSTEFWTLFHYGSTETICSKHKTLPKAEKAVRVCERRGGAKHRIVQVSEIVAYAKPDGSCEYRGCRSKATWDVCAKDGRSVARCGKHKMDVGLTLQMRRVGAV